MWKPVRQWSHLICLAIYVDSQVLIQSLLPTLLARFQRPTYPLVSVGLHGLLPIQTASKLCIASGCDAMYRQVSWLVPAKEGPKKGQRESATIATVGVGDHDEAESRGREAEKVKARQLQRSRGRRIQPACGGAAKQPSYPHSDGVPRTRHHRRADSAADVAGRRADLRTRHGPEGARP